MLEGGAGLKSPTGSQRESFFSHLRKRARRLSGRNQGPMSPNADDLEANVGCAPWAVNNNNNNRSSIPDAQAIAPMATDPSADPNFAQLDKALQNVRYSLDATAGAAALQVLNARHHHHHSHGHRHSGRHHHHHHHRRHSDDDEVTTTKTTTTTYLDQPSSVFDFNLPQIRVPEIVVPTPRIVLPSPTFPTIVSPRPKSPRIMYREPPTPEVVHYTVRSQSSSEQSSNLPAIALSVAVGLFVFTVIAAIIIGSNNAPAAAPSLREPSRNSPWFVRWCVRPASRDATAAAPQPNPDSRRCLELFETAARANTP